MIRAFVGSGGKTGTIFKQAAALREQGKRVLVTTSTQMGAREGTIIGDNPLPVIAALERDGYAMAGTKASREGKIAALSEETFRAVCPHADIVLVEADGSRQHPLKFPNDNEPVIPEGTEEIFVICGLSAIGKPAKDVCHRLELVKAAIGIQDDTIITEKHVRELIRKAYVAPLSLKYPDASITVYPCQRDTPQLHELAVSIQKEFA
ncbi:MAG: putative selenium-dependent hydroxylase accessory protein YqeC [Clostridia bacterium]|nr:putative selenium-dependent hydroxylase accessory protein YqeC [Clostridia bacterium]